jgi:hypothetical protein
MALVVETIEPALRGKASPDVGDECRALLMPAWHELDRRIFERREQIFRLFAGQAEDVTDAFGLKTFDDEIRDFHMHVSTDRIRLARKSEVHKASLVPAERLERSALICQFMRISVTGGAGLSREPQPITADPA